MNEKRKQKYRKQLPKKHYKENTPAPIVSRLCPLHTIFSYGQKQQIHILCGQHQQKP